MPLLAEVTADEVLGIVARVGEILFGFCGSAAALYFMFRKRRQELSQDQYRADQERADDERQVHREERDHTIQELRALIEEAKEDAREAKREQRKSQDATARKIAEIQAAHFVCEKSLAAQAVQVSHLTEVYQNALQRIKELEHRTNGN